VSIMRLLVVLLVLVVFGSNEVPASDTKWYTGDEFCRPPKDDGTYSAPYDAQEHPNDYPTFQGADKPGWSCSYQRADGVIVQHGDSRTPQEKWKAIWSGGDEINN
jgi:hypothetical protein